ILAFRKLDADAARRAFEECLVIAKERDYVRLIVRANTGMARLALRRGDTKEVRKWSEAGLAIARAWGGKADAVTPLHMLGAARRQFDTTGLAMDPDEGPEYEKGLAAIRAALDETAFSAAWAAGKKMNLDEAVAFALGPSA